MSTLDTGIPSQHLQNLYLSPWPNLVMPLYPFIYLANFHKGKSLRFFVLWERDHGVRHYCQPVHPGPSTRAG